MTCIALCSIFNDSAGTLRVKTGASLLLCQGKSRLQCLGIWQITLRHAGHSRGPRVFSLTRPLVQLTIWWLKIDQTLDQAKTGLICGTGGVMGFGWIWSTSIETKSVLRWCMRWMSLYFLHYYDTNLQWVTLMCSLNNLCTRQLEGQHMQIVQITGFWWCSSLSWCTFVFSVLQEVNFSRLPPFALSVIAFSVNIFFFFLSFSKWDIKHSCFSMECIYTYKINETKKCKISVFVFYLFF